MNADLPKNKKLVSISEAAKYLGVSIDTVRRWDKTGALKSERPDGKNRYFSLDELESHKLNQPLSISEASKKLKISPTTLRRLETKGILVPLRNSAGERVYDKEDLKKFLASDYILRKKQTKKRVRKPLIKKTNAQPSSNHSKSDNLKDDVVSDKEKDFDIFSEMPTKVPDFIAIAIALFVLLITVGTGNVVLASKPVWSTKAPAVLTRTITSEKPTSASISAKTTPAEASVEVEPQEATKEAQPITLESIYSLMGPAEDATEATKSAKAESGQPDQNSLKIILTAKTLGAEYIEIKEKPSTESAIVARAKDGDTFEMISWDSNWYQVKLTSFLKGYIPYQAAQIKEINQ